MKTHSNENHAFETSEQPQEKAAPEIRPATLYSEWKQMPVYKGSQLVKPAAYMVVIGVVVKAGRVVRYELLKLFTKDLDRLSDITPEKFQELMDKGILVEWNG